MASSKVMVSSKPRNSDLSSLSKTASRSRRTSSSAKPQEQSWPPPPSVSPDRGGNDAVSTITVDGISRDVVYAAPSAESTLLDAQITLIDPPPNPLPSPDAAGVEVSQNGAVPSGASKTVEEVWREIVAGRKEMKEEPDEMMTLEDFLVKAGAVDVVEEEDMKLPIPQPLTSERLSGGMYSFDPVVVPPLSTAASAFQVVGGGGGGGRGKRGRGAALMEPLDKAAQQRQRRMIKNRESAARSRERKQAYQVELESMAVRLEAENERLLKEKEEWTKERFKQLMEKIFPVVEKRRPPRSLRRVRSFEW